MDTHEAEPAQTVDAPAVPVDQPNVDSGEPRTVSGSLPHEDEWTWISDAAEVEIPTPPTEHKPSPVDALIKALAWVNANYWR